MTNERKEERNRILILLAIIGISYYFIGNW